MYSDFLFNFTQILEEAGQEESANILSRFAGTTPYFGLDCGIEADDIWGRVKKFRECVELIEDEDKKRILNSMIHFSAGIMPDYDSVENRFEVVEKLESTIKDFKNSGDPFSDRLIAIGPSGIDHDWESVEYEGRIHDYFDNRTVHEEKDLFALQLTLAKKLDMPFILHSRRGFAETQDVLKAVKWNKGVVHGFAYSQSELEFFLNLGWYISFCGTVTYSGKKNWIDMTDAVTYVPKDRLIIESDSPYYTPIPLKCVKNDPTYVNYTLEYIASKRALPKHKLSEQVDKNLKKLFNLD